MDYTKKDGKKVWAAFKEMESYLDKSFQVLTEVDEENNYINQKNLKMYDGVSTLLNTNIGHKNPYLIKAIYNQLIRLDNSTLFTATNDVEIECSKKLCELTDQHFFSCFFTNSGSEACDTALKIVKKYSFNKGKKACGIVSLKGAYHGSNLTAMKICQTQYENKQYYNDCTGYFQINTPNVENCPEALTEEEWIDACVEEYRKIAEKEEIGAIFMELIQLSNGVNILPVRYVQEIVRISRENNVLVVIDEVATGFGRTGTMFASEYYGIWADIMMFAKGVTSGYIPMGGVMVTEEVFNNFTGVSEKMLENGFTTGGHPVACAAAIENINLIIKENMVENAEKMGNYLREKMIESFGDSFLVKEIRGKGLMLALVLEDLKVIGMPQYGIADVLARFLINKGLLLYPDSSDILIIAPVLSIKQEKCDFIIEQLKQCILKAEKCVSGGKEYVK